MKPRPTIVVLFLLAASAALAQPAASPKPRARDLGLAAAIGGMPGPLDAITDVAGVEVGHVTLIEGGPDRAGAAVLRRSHGAGG